MAMQTILRLSGFAFCVLICAQAEHCDEVVCKASAEGDQVPSASTFGKVQKLPSSLEAGKHDYTSLLQISDNVRERRLSVAQKGSSRGWQMAKSRSSGAAIFLAVWILLGGAALGYYGYTSQVTDEGPEEKEVAGANEENEAEPEQEEPQPKPQLKRRGTWAMADGVANKKEEEDAKEADQRVPGSPARLQRRRSIAFGEIKKMVKEWKTTDAIGTLGGGSFVVTMVCDLSPNGIVPLPNGLVNTGFVPGMLLLVVFYGCCVCTMWMISRTAFITGQMSFADQWAQLVGKGSAWIPLAILIAVCFGNTIEYLCFVADLLSGCLPAFGIPLSRGVCAWLFALFPTLPLCFLKDLSALAPTSFFGLASVVFLVIAMIIRACDGTYAPGGMFYNELPKALKPNVPQSHWSQFGLPSLVLVNGLAMGFLPHYNGCKYYRELKHHEPTRFLKCTAMGMGGVGAMYVIAMIVGYSTFGTVTNSVITESYAKQDLLFNVVRLCLGFSILASFPIMFSGLREAVLQLLLEVGEVDCSEVWKQDAMTFGMVVVIALITSLLTNSAVVVGLVGAICGNAVIFLLPGYLYAQALAVDAVGINTGHLTLTRIFLVLGVLLMVGGVYSTFAF